MANLGNTIINGILRVNGDINAGGSIKAPTLIGNLTGNASSATKLQTARKINGIAFDGTKDIIIEAGSSGHTILNSSGTTMTQRSKLKFMNSTVTETTANWGTARNIGIVNSDGTGTAVVTSVNGSANINLKLPSTIKATITGNASTATKLQTARKINGVAFDGTKDITISAGSSGHTILNSSGTAMAKRSKLKFMNSTVTDDSANDTTIITPSGITGNYLPLSGGTLTTNSYNGLTIKRSDANGSSILYSNSAGALGRIGFNFGGDLIITNGTGTDGTANMLNIKKDGNIIIYNSLSPSSNNSRTLGTSALKWNNVYATTFTGNLSGNAVTASSAAKLTTPRTIGLEGDVETVTSKTFDGSANLLIQSKRRGCYVGLSKASSNNQWFKVASYTTSSSNFDSYIIFNVYSGYGNGQGILKAHIRTNSNSNFQEANLRWLAKSSDIPLGDFILAHNTGAKPTIVELWCKVTTGYKSYNFDVMSEGIRGGRTSGDWTLYNNYSDGVATPTSGYTQIASTMIILSNTIAGGSTFANQLNAIEDRDIKPNVTPKARVSAYFTSKAGLNGTADSDYQDLLVMNTWGDTGGQNVNALAFDKNTKAIYHYQAAQTATTWGTAHQLAYTTSNVSSASTLQTARTINGTSFNGSANITTANWGTARNIGIVNSDGTGTAVPVSVNGSGNVNLKLPATIKASLSGNASTATTATKANQLTTARTIGVSGVTGTAQSFNGTANITIPITAVPASLLTGKNAIKASEINNDKHFIPSSTNTVANIVAMTQSSFNSSGSSLPNNTLVAITDGNDSYVSTQATSITCDLPLDL